MNWLDVAKIIELGTNLLGMNLTQLGHPEQRRRTNLDLIFPETAGPSTALTGADTGEDTPFFPSTGLVPKQIMSPKEMLRMLQQLEI